MGVGKSVLKGAEEALAIAKGEAVECRVTVEITKMKLQNRFIPVKS